MSVGSLPLAEAKPGQLGKKKKTFMGQLVMLGTFSFLLLCVFFFMYIQGK